MCVNCFSATHFYIVPPLNPRRCGWSSYPCLVERLRRCQPTDRAENIQFFFATSFVCLSQVCRTKEWRHDAILGLKNSFCDKCDKHFLGIKFNVFHFLPLTRKSFIHQIVSINVFWHRGKNWKSLISLPWKSLSQLSQFFFWGDKWLNGAVYKTQKVRQASSGVCRTLSQKKSLCNFV